MKVNFDNEYKDMENEKPSFSWKLILVCVLSVIVVAGLSILGYKTLANKRGINYDSPYTLADDFVTYTYQGDTESIFKMQPRVFQERSIQNTQMSNGLEESDVSGAVELLKRPLAKYMETLKDQHGQWTETHEVDETMYTYTEKELDALQKLLKYQGVDEEWIYEITNAGIVNVSVKLNASNGSGGYDHTVRVPVYEYDGRWYLGQRIGDVFLAAVEGEHDPYGDLLDGFIITDSWDADGNKVIQNEEEYGNLKDEETGIEPDGESFTE